MKLINFTKYLLLPSFVVFFVFVFFGYFKSVDAAIDQQGVVAGVEKNCVATGDTKTKDVKSMKRSQFTNMKSLATGRAMVWKCTPADCGNATPGSKNTNLNGTKPNQELCCEKIKVVKGKKKCIGDMISTDEGKEPMKFVQEEKPKDSLMDKLKKAQEKFENSPRGKAMQEEQKSFDPNTRLDGTKIEPEKDYVPPPNNSFGCNAYLFNSYNCISG